MTSPARRIDLRQLRYFLAVAEEANFRRAAERLHLTQPPLTRQIAALEQALGVRLLERDTVGTRLTRAGERAQREFGRLLAQADAAFERVARAEAEAPRRLRVGVLWWADLSVFAGFERALQAALGPTTVEPVLAPSVELLRRLRRGRLDAALIALPQTLDGLPVRNVARVEHVAVIPARHPLARRRAVRLRELATLPAFLRFRRGANPLLYDHFSRLYARAGFRPQVERQAPGTEETIAQIAAGRGCTVMPAAFARRRHPGVAARRLLDDVHLDVAMVVAPQLPSAVATALLRHAGRLKRGLV